MKKFLYILDTKASKVEGLQLLALQKGLSLLPTPSAEFVLQH